MFLIMWTVSFLSVSSLAQARAAVPVDGGVRHRQEPPTNTVIVLPIQRLTGDVGANLTNYLVNSMSYPYFLNTNANVR
jgi:hypothetical protein